MSANGWVGVDLRHLAALEAVARTGSFGRAARELGYTQSAVSQQIAQLERIVGQRLFDRPGGPRPVEPTEAGLLLLRHADAIVGQLDAARADMAALAEGEAGTLRVGIYQSVGAPLPPPRPALPRQVAAGRCARGGGELGRRPAAPAQARRARPQLRRPAATGRAVRMGRATPGSVRPARLGALGARRARRGAAAARSREAAADRPAQHRRARAVPRRTRPRRERR